MSLHAHFDKDSLLCASKYLRMHQFTRFAMTFETRLCWDRIFLSVVRLDTFTSVVREARISQRNGGPITGPVKPLDTILPWCLRGYTDHPPSLRIGHIYMKDTHSAASNEKSSGFYFWVMTDCINNLRCYTWFSKCVTDQHRPKVAKFTEKMRNDLERMKDQFSDF